MGVLGLLVSNRLGFSDLPSHGHKSPGAFVARYPQALNDGFLGEGSANWKLPKQWKDHIGWFKAL